MPAGEIQRERLAGGRTARESSARTQPPDDRFVSACTRRGESHTLRSRLATEDVEPTAGKRLGRPWRTSEFDFVRGRRRALVRASQPHSFGPSAVEQGRGCGSHLGAGAAVSMERDAPRVERSPLATGRHWPL